MVETLTREHMVSWLAAVEASPWRTVGAPQADLRTALEMARASLDLAEQLSAAQRELVEVRAAAKALVDAADACEREAENHPSSRSSAPLVRYVAAMNRLRETLKGHDR